jgi:short-subunit dehydrogenase
MSRNNREIRSAFVTGAAHGIGAAFARRLAATRTALQLIDKDGDALMALADELRAGGAVVEPIVADLSSAVGQDLVVSALAEQAQLDLLINNAGFGRPELFHVQAEHQILEMLHLHVTAPVRFCRAALPAMIARRNGAIINVCSLAQFLPFAGNAMYSASKTFLLRHSEILDHEVGKHGIKVQALIPGYTATTFHNSDGYAATKQRIPGVLWSSADFVAATSLRDLDAGKLESIPGTLNRWIAFLLRSGICPHRLIQRWVI